MGPGEIFGAVDLAEMPGPCNGQMRTQVKRVATPGKLLRPFQMTHLPRARNFLGLQSSRLQSSKEENHRDSMMIDTNLIICYRLLRLYFCIAYTAFGRDQASCAGHHACSNSRDRAHWPGRAVEAGETFCPSAHGKISWHSRCQTCRCFKGRRRVWWQHVRGRDSTGCCSHDGLGEGLRSVSGKTLSLRTICPTRKNKIENTDPDTHC
jgi:hypothetical protein